MTISALSIVKRPAPHCAKPAVSESGFRLAAITRLTEAILAHIQSVYTRANRNQRCFRVSSDGGLAVQPNKSMHGDRDSLATFRANSSQVDRSQLCMPRGFKPATHGVFRPGRTGLRKTPSGWLSANIFEKTILVPCAWTIDNTGKPPFLVGVYDLVLPENNTTGATSEIKDAL